MATVTNLDSSIRLTYSCGVDGDGKEVRKRKTLSSVKHAAVDDDVYAVATSIGTLQENPITEVVRSDNKAIEA